MNTQTFFNGYKFPGEEHEVPADTARRWVKKGIASFAEDQDINEVDQEVMDDVNPVDSYKGMKAKELYDLCAERGIEAEVKQSKEYYIEKLAEFDNAKAEEGSSENTGTEE